MVIKWNNEVFSKNLRRFIEQSGKSQREIAEHLGVSYSTFNEWTKGKKYPRIDKIEQLASYFGCLKSDLIEDKTVNISDYPNIPPERLELIRRVQQMSPEELKRFNALLSFVEENY